MRSFSFWQKWLLGAFASQIFLGLGLVFLGPDIVFWKMSEHLNNAIWGAATVPDMGRQYQDFTSGVLGATLAGWAVSMLFVVQNPFSRREPWAWNCAAAGVVCWFALDSWITFKFSVWPNEVLNVISLTLLGLPLIFTRKHFRGL